MHSLITKRMRQQANNSFVAELPTLLSSVTFCAVSNSTDKYCSKPLKIQKRLRNPQQNLGK